MRKGFTLLEITVVITIIVLLGTIFIANYRGGEKSFALKRSAHQLSQDLRNAQEMAISSQKFEETFPKGGYGIYFKKNSNSYILFADCDGDHQYDEGGAALTCAEANPLTSFSEKIKEISLEKGITISEISPSSSDNSLSVTFFPPEPIIEIYPQANSASITIGFNGQSKTVNINKVGLIDIE